MKRNNLPFLCYGFLFLTVSMFLSLLLGSVGINTASLLSALLKGEKTTETSIFIYSRLPRTWAPLPPALPWPFQELCFKAFWETGLRLLE